MSDSHAVNPLKDLLRRLSLGRAWVAAQYWATVLLVLLGLAWTRLPDKHVWQVALSLLVPLLLLIFVLVLEAGTLRALADDDGRCVKLLPGACSLLVWIAVAWVAWVLLDWCDDQIPIWAGYLNSRAPAHARARFLTYEHLQRGLLLFEWILRWIAIPGKLIPCALASAQWGWRLPVRKLPGVLLRLRWWIGMVLAALAGVALPGRFFAGLPNGTVAHQVWAVILKLCAAYLLAMSSWVLLLCWAAVLLSRGSPGTNRDGDDSIVPVPVIAGPHREDSVRLPLPEESGDPGGNA